MSIQRLIGFSPSATDFTITQIHTVCVYNNYHIEMVPYWPPRMFRNPIILIFGLFSQHKGASIRRDVAGLGPITVLEWYIYFEG